MANTATLLTTCPQGTGASANGPVFALQIGIDTPNTDLTVFTPKSPTSRLFIVGMVMSESQSGSVSLKSGSAYTQTLSMGAFQGLGLPVASHWLFVTRPGDALILQASMNVSSLVLYVVESEHFFAA
jgi:hypothetical protein